MAHFPVAILILFFEKAEQTIECLKGFVESGLPIYLLDNGSSLESRAVLDGYAKNYTNIHISHEVRNIGVGPGRNRLINASREEWLFFVDNDIVIESQDWLKFLAMHIRTHPDIEVFVPRLYNWHEQQWVEYSNFEIVAREMRRVPLIEKQMNNFPGGAAIVRRNLFDRFGVYDEQIFVGGEDYELSLRGLIQSCPIKALQVEDIVLVHHHRAARDAASRTAANVRYDHELIAASMRYIENKHGISVCTGWKTWTSQQLRLMTQGEPFLSRLKRQIKILLGKTHRFH